MVSKIKVVAALIGAVVSVGANASAVSLTGSSFTVTYDDSITTLFGAPTLSGNLLTFSPQSFSVVGVSAQPSFTSGLLGLQVSALAGYQLNSVSLYEQGNFRLVGPNSGFGIGETMSVVPSDSAGATNIQRSGALSGQFFETGSWIIDQAAVSGLSSRAANVTLNPFLFATGGTGSIAFANLTTAKLTFATSLVAPVPEPDAYLMMLTGLGMVGVIARRRSVVR
jgi:hypothetical protein